MSMQKLTTVCYHVAPSFLVCAAVIQVPAHIDHLYLVDREVACSASDRQGSTFESCVWRTVSSQSSHHPQEVLLAQFSLYVHKGGLKPDSFHYLVGPAARVHRCSPVYSLVALWVGLIAKYYARINSNIPLVAPSQVVIIDCNTTDDSHSPRLN